MQNMRRARARPPNDKKQNKLQIPDKILSDPSLYMDILPIKRPKRLLLVLPLEGGSRTFEELHSRGYIGGGLPYIRGATFEGLPYIRGATHI